MGKKVEEEWVLITRDHEEGKDDEGDVLAPLLVSKAPPMPS